MERAGRVISRWKKSRDCVTLADLARAAWRVAAGDKIAARTLDVELIRHRLVVSVDDDIWRRQLWTLRHMLLHNLAENLGAGVVDQIEIRVTPRRIGPGREGFPPAASGDDADRIQDPMLRRLYKASRREASA